MAKASSSKAASQASAQVFLYTGPEFGERNDAVDALREKARKKFGDVENFLFYAYETTVDEIVSVLQSGSLFSSAQFVVCRYAEAIKKKEDVQRLLDWMTTSNDESAILVLVSDEISIDKNITALVHASNKKVFWEMFEDRKVPYIQKYFSDNGFTIEEEAAEYILELVENNTQAIKAECQRFFLSFPPSSNITVDDIENVISHTKEESAFTLFAMMTTLIEGDTQKTLESCIDILQKILLSKNSASVMILAGLSSCFRKVCVWHNLVAEGKQDDFNLKINGFSSKKLQAQYRRASQIWNLRQAVAIKALIAETDTAIRQTGSALEEIYLQKLIIEIVAKKGLPLATYE